MATVTLKSVAKYHNQSFDDDHVVELKTTCDVSIDSYITSFNAFLYAVGFANKVKLDDGEEE